MFNPFEILHLKQTYSLDQDVLEAHYFEAQRKTHPDQFSRGNEQEKAEAMEKSTAVNQAYLILRDPLLRAEYLLKMAGIDLLSNDSAFLEHVMEWNERLARGEDLHPDLKVKEKELLTGLENAFFLHDHEMARRVLYQLTYLQKLLK